MESTDNIYKIRGFHTGRIASLGHFSVLFAHFLKMSGDAHNIRILLDDQLNGYMRSPQVLWVDADENERVVYFEYEYERFQKEAPNLGEFFKEISSKATLYKWNEAKIVSVFEYVRANLPENMWRSYVYQEVSWRHIHFDVAYKIKSLISEIHPNDDFQELGSLFTAFREHFDSLKILHLRPLVPFRQYRDNCNQVSFFNNSIG